MFQAWLVKMAKTQASSAPNTRPGDRRQEPHHGHRHEAQDRHRLQDIQQRHQQGAGARVLGRPGGIGEGESQRNAHARSASAGRCARHSRAAGRDPGSDWSALTADSGWTRKRLASAKTMMKPSTSTAASRSQRLGSRRRASIETGGRIFMSGGPRGRAWLRRLFPARIGGFAWTGNLFEAPGRRRAPAWTWRALRGVFHDSALADRLSPKYCIH